MVWCATVAMISNPELIQVLGAVLPYPVYPFCCFVPKIGRIEVPAEKKHKDNVLRRRSL